MNKKIIGNRGEELAVTYLKKEGYKILERNFAVKGAEIDIVAKINDTLVFVEVKTRENLEFGYPAEAVTIAKQKKIIMAAKCYLTLKKKCNSNCCFDVIEVLGDEINHIKNAFWVN